MYEDFRRFSFEKNVPMAKLVRFAIDKTFEDELDIIAATRGMEEHLKDPSGAITSEELMAQHGIERRHATEQARGGKATR